MAREERPVRRLINEDFPTLLRPMIANSGNPVEGQSFTLTLLLINSALRTRTLWAAGSLISKTSREEAKTKGFIFNIFPEKPNAKKNR